MLGEAKKHPANGKKNTWVFFYFFSGWNKQNCRNYLSTQFPRPGFDRGEDKQKAWLDDSDPSCLAECAMINWHFFPPWLPPEIAVPSVRPSTGKNCLSATNCLQKKYKKFCLYKFLGVFEKNTETTHWTIVTGRSRSAIGPSRFSAPWPHIFRESFELK